MDKSRASKSLVVKRFAGFSLYQRPHETTQMTWMNPKRKNFGRPIRKQSRVGKPKGLNKVGHRNRKG